MKQFPFQALINLAGSNDNSSRQFQLHLPWSRQVINSNSHQNPTLAEIGLLQSSSIDVEWINEVGLNKSYFIFTFQVLLQPMNDLHQSTLVTSLLTSVTVVFNINFGLMVSYFDHC